MPGAPKIAPPRREGLVRVGRRRVLGYAEFGDPSGRLVLWHHGTPGARRQVPLIARRALPSDSVFGLCASSGLASASRRITGISASGSGR
jgi:hypothetical protein